MCGSFIDLCDCNACLSRCHGKTANDALINYRLLRCSLGRLHMLFTLSPLFFVDAVLETSLCMDWKENANPWTYHLQHLGHDRWNLPWVIHWTNFHPTSWGETESWPHEEPGQDLFVSFCGQQNMGPFYFAINLNFVDFEIPSQNPGGRTSTSGTAIHQEMRR